MADLPFPWDSEFSYMLPWRKCLFGASMGLNQLVRRSVSHSGVSWKMFLPTEVSRQKLHTVVSKAKGNDIDY